MFFYTLDLFIFYVFSPNHYNYCFITVIIVREIGFIKRYIIKNKLKNKSKLEENLTMKNITVIYKYEIVFQIYIYPI